MFLLTLQRGKCDETKRHNAVSDCKHRQTRLEVHDD